MEKLEPQVMCTFRGISLIFVLLCIFRIPLYSQNQSLFDYVNTFDSVDVFIETNFRDLLKRKDKYQSAHIYLQSGEKTMLDTIGEIRTRGNMRKNVCYMPPTKLRFAKGYLRNHQWSEYPTMKVVNCCAFNDLSKTYVELEYILYKIYNLLTDRSLKACTVSLHYIDTEGKKKPAEFNGFLLEHEDQLADRIQGDIYDGTYFKVNQLDHQAYILFTVFQFMIGNTDWKVLNKHNMEVIRVASDRTCYPIPYDFDYSGVVHATYAVPHESLPISAVTERLYLGPCLTEAEVTEICHLFLNKKQEILQLVDQNLTGERHIRACKNYLEEFFRIAENDKNAKAIFMNCRDY